MFHCDVTGTNCAEPEFLLPWINPTPWAAIIIRVTTEVMTTKPLVWLNEKWKQHDISTLPRQQTPSGWNRLDINPTLPSVWALIARLMGPTWGLTGAGRTQVGPRWAPWILLSGRVYVFVPMSNWCWTEVILLSKLKYHNREIWNYSHRQAMV